ncbi:hypothetical protein PHISP_07540, partial [Aspergillus sp. HF37]
PVSLTKHSQPQPEAHAQAQHAPDPIPAALIKYLSAPTLETTSDLEDWVARAIENDTFMRLCWDAEGYWRRVAFGR